MRHVTAKLAGIRETLETAACDPLDTAASIAEVYADAVGIQIEGIDQIINRIEEVQS